MHVAHPHRRALAAVVILAVGLLLGPLAPTVAARPAGSSLSEGAGPVCSAPPGNARLVRFIYLNILFRCPEPTAESYWTGRLDGGLARSRFAEIVDLSSENMVNDNVVPLYQDILGRPPTAPELAAGVAEIRARQADARFIAHLVSSDEFYAAFDPGMQDKAEAWLTFLYENILDRAPDPAGLAYFLGVMGNPPTAATRERVARALELSPENDAGWTFAVYFAGLNRPPDDAGFAYWTGWLAGPGQKRTFKMWTSILSSSEGYARAQTQPDPEGPPEAAASTGPEGTSNKVALAD